MASPQTLASAHAVRVGLPDLFAPVPRVGLLAGRSMAAFVTAAGSGTVAFDGRALTRWRGDRVRDADGVFFYLRDLDGAAVWSAGFEPTKQRPERYAARLTPGAVEIEREDGGIETRLSVCVAPDAPVALYVLALANRSGRPRRIEVTSYAELVLHDRAADRAHPAFSKLFVETERSEVPAGETEKAEGPTLLARRRPRSPEDEPIWAAHFTDGEPAGWETDRARFIGRGRSLDSPAALEGDLSGTLGAVLDPVFSLRRFVELAPDEETEVVFGLAGGRSREEVAALAERFAASEVVEAAFAGASERAERVRESLGLSAPEAQRLDALAGALLYGDPALRAPDEVLRAAAGPLAEVSVPPHVPLVAARVQSAQDVETVRGLARARAYWEQQGLETALVVLADSAVQSAAEAIAGGARVIPLGELEPEAEALLASAARLFVDGQMPERDERAGAIPPPAPDRALDGGATQPEGGEDLREFNGFGGFSADGTEYVIRVAPDERGRLRLPPLPWANVVANERAGFIATERGASTTWAANSREHRLTPWHNDPVSDPLGEAFYLRDEDTGAFWSPTPGPAPRPAPYEVRHGWGSTTYRHAADGLAQELTLFVPRHDPVRLARLRLTNRGDRPRRLTAFSYARLVFGVEPEQSGPFVMTEADRGTLLATNRTAGEFADLVGFAAVAGAEPTSFTTDRAAFLGRHGSEAAPRALLTGEPLDGQAGAGLDPCFALAVPLEIPPGETAEVTFLLGQVEGREAALDLAARYRRPGAVAEALEEVCRFWRETVTAVQIQTPEPALDLLVNGWLLYQDLSCRLWGRTAFYQSGGAFGFRDQVQDAAALVYTRPDLTRQQILLHAAHQFEEGDVLHWWHPPLSKGIRTRFSDDLLWLPYVAAFYVETTGDEAIWDEEACYLTARPLADGEDEAFLFPEDAGTSGTLYDHCCRALDRSLTKGPHGLPLMGTGDWNDGMNRVGREGRGESVWLGFFLFDILRRFVPVCEARGDAEHAARYRAHLDHLNSALNEAGWDGEWYRRAYYDSGAVIGSRESDECRIDAIAQAWAVLSGAAPPERAASALAAAEAHLVSEADGLIRLLTPPFDETPHDPGYIKGYVPGVRENGGQYTHGVLWLIRALAEAGRCEHAAPLLAMLSPVHHTRTPEAAERYKTEPYVVAADVYGVAPHVGRGGWTWYTGSAGWMYRVAVESVCGLTVEHGQTLVLKPCIPSDWGGCSVRYRLPGDGSVYEIAVEGSGAVARAEADGEAVPVEAGAARVPLRRDGGTHRVRVTLA